ncbi:MAG: hypothetical protein ABI759_19655 [Candidatus Solibacter sp.]
MRRIVVLLLVAIPALTAPPGTIRITGQIPCAGYLAPADAEPGLLLVGSGTAVSIHAPPGRTSFTLSLRTNCSYRLVAAQLSGAGLQVVEGAVSAAGGGAHLAASALQASIAPVALGTAPTAFASGHRVSNGGNNRTVDNAILLRIVVESNGPEEAVANVALELVP